MAYALLAVDQTVAGAAEKTTITPAATIADVAALTGGEAPTEAEFNALAVKFNAVLAALEAAGILASA